MKEQIDVINKFIELQDKLPELGEEFTQSLNLQMFKYIQENNIQLFYNPSPLQKVIKLEPIELSETREVALKNNTCWIDYVCFLSFLKENLYDLSDLPNLKIDIYKCKDQNMNCISCKNIKTHNPENFVKLDEFFKSHLKNSPTISQIIMINQEIKELSNNLKEQYNNDKNKIVTELYKYYYNHLDKYVKEKPNFFNYNPIEFFISKHNLTSMNYNVKLDYLQWYWKIHLYLLSDFEVELGGLENNFVFKFTNKDVIMTLEQHRGYTNTYSSPYSITKKYLTENKIFENPYYMYSDERKIDSYYRGLINFIFDNLDKIYHK